MAKNHSKKIIYSYHNKYFPYAWKNIYYGILNGLSSGRAFLIVLTPIGVERYALYGILNAWASPTSVSTGFARKELYGLSSGRAILIVLTLKGRALRAVWKNKLFCFATLRVSGLRSSPTLSQWNKYKKVLCYVFRMVWLRLCGSLWWLVSGFFLHVKYRIVLYIRSMKILSKSQIFEVANSCPDFSLTVFIYVMFSTGARISEVCNLVASDLDRSSSSIFIRGLKGGYERYIPVPGSLFAMLDIYWKMYNRPLDKGTKVFPLTSQSWRKWVEFEFHKHKIDMTPHALRHARATDFMNSGAPIPMIQGFLGHRAVSSTEQYTHYAIEPMRKFL